MNKLHSSIQALREQLKKEISGFVFIFGDNIDVASAQQSETANKRFNTTEVKVLSLSKLPDIKIHTPQLRRIMTFNATPLDLTGLSHTWDETSEINMEDLISIHTALQNRFDTICHRNSE